MCIRDRLMFNDDKYHRGGNFTKPLLQEAASNAVPDASEPVVEFVKQSRLRNGDSIVTNSAILNVSTPGVTVERID